jgi:hypothetical protein
VDESLYPFNFSTLREGGEDPVQGKKIKWIVASDDDYIVYIDEKDRFVEWTMNSNDLLAGAGDHLTRVGWLEAADVRHLSSGQLDTYKRLIAEGAARLFERDFESATRALDGAQRWITARSQEAARLWSLQGATAMFAVSLVAYGVALFLWRRALVEGGGLVATGGFVGFLGAWLSVLQRTGKMEVDLAAGPRIHRVEGVVRVIIGGLGGFFAALLLWSRLVLPDAIHNRALFVAICMVAGVSERMVNSLVGTLVGTIVPVSDLPASPAPGLPTELPAPRRRHTPR